MSSPKSSINLSCLRPVFTNCTSFKPQCKKGMCRPMVEGAIVKISFYSFHHKALPFHHKLGTIRKTPPFFRSLVWCSGRWRQRDPWDLAHVQTLFRPPANCNPKIDTNFLNFYRADFVSQEGILWAHLWEWPRKSNLKSSLLLEL